MTKKDKGRKLHNMLKRALSIALMVTLILTTPGLIPDVDVPEAEKAEAASAGYALSVPNGDWGEVTHGSAIYVTASAPNNSGAWVGLYENSVTPQNGKPSIAYYYVQDKSGTQVNILNYLNADRTSNVVCGSYKVVLFHDGGYTAEATLGIKSVPNGAWTTTKAATCTATGTEKRTCSKCSGSETRTTAALWHSYTVAATCTTAKKCSRCTATTGSALGHSYGSASYSWSSDNKTCTASRTCSRCSGKDTKTVNSTSTTTAATCTAAGSTKYTATFSSPFSTQTKTVTIAALGHSYGNASYSWSSDNKTCTASRTCSRCSGKDTKTVDSTSSTTAATCTAAGSTKYTATFSSPFSTQTKTVTIAALGHSYEKTKTTNPTDSSQGYTTYTCSVCGDNYKDDYTYYVRFNGNGSTSGSMDDMQLLHVGQAESLNANKYSRKGYTFAGWNTNEFGLGQLYLDKGSVTDLSISEDVGIVDLYAQWSKDTYNITYNNMDGAVNHGSNPETYQVDTETITLQEPTKPGYTFGGWYADAEFSGDPVTQIEQGSTGNKTFYAKWTANTYTVSFDATGGECSTASKTVTHDSTYGDLPAPTKMGYTFDGWYTEESGGEKVTSSTTVSIIDDQTLFAQWSKDTYAITYGNMDGAVNHGSNPETYQVDTETITLQEPTKPGYTFGGWYADAEFSGDPVTQIEQGSTGNKTFYAKWNLITYSITYKEKDESVISESNYTVETEDITLPTPTKPGYNFGGWFTSSDFFGTAVTQVTKGSTEDKTFYAKWDAKSYTITFNSNPEEGEAETKSKTYLYGEGGKLPTDIFTKDGSAIVSWNTESDYSGESYTKVQDVLEDYVDTTEPILLYAEWDVAKCTIVATKTISAAGINFAHGDPTFIFKVADGDSVYHKAVSFTREYVEANKDGNDMVSASVEFTDLPKASYTVTEVDTYRYASEKKSEVCDFTTASTTDDYSKTVEFDGSVKHYRRFGHNALSIFGIE